VLQIFITGAGQTKPPGVDGQLAGATPWFPLGTVTATIGGVDAKVDFAGLAPQFTGVYQVNVFIPAGIPANAAAPMLLSINGVDSFRADPTKIPTIAVR